MSDFLQADGLAFLIVLFVIAVAGIQTWAEILNLGALRPEVPASFADVYDAEAYEKSQRYTRANTAFWLGLASLRSRLVAGFLGNGWL